MQPEGLRIGTLNEDFAFESLPGDVFQLGNMSYRIAKVETVRSASAFGFSTIYVIFEDVAPSDWAGAGKLFGETPTA